MRKKSMLSQEQLAEKLDVTRQTVSKWELGQSKPDMDKLTAMSKLFNVSIDVLTNDDEIIDSDTSVKNEEKSNHGGSVVKRKYVLYILIAILIAASTTLAVRIGNSIKAENEKRAQEEHAIKDDIKRRKEEIDKKIQDTQKKNEDMKKENEKASFNRTYEIAAGTASKARVSWTLDDVMTNNKKNSDRLIEVIFNETSYGTSSNEIVKIKSLLKNFEGYNIVNYEVSFDYSEDGYINKMTIKEQ
ncbi:MAG: helix-turn-helix domain-containing protein [Tenericutes bacterium]|nr:helix-turn-helix domain-containing protein [Mycoplasmatota bacterium]